MIRPHAPKGALLLFGLLSLAAVAAGVGVCLASGAPAGLVVRNLAAWLVGALAAGGLAALWRPGWSAATLILATAGIALTFVSPDQQGVHRWLAIRPLFVNAAMLLLPAAVVAAATLAARGSRLWPVVVAPLALLALQPDASQAAALGAATVLIAAAAAPGGRAVRLGVAAAAIGIAAAAWLRPDPLQPVAEVEGVLGLAWRLSPLAAAGSLAALLAACAAPAVASRRVPGPARLAGGALTVLLLGWTVTPFLGAFPVPLVGMGMSPILGAWLGVGLLAGTMRRG